MSCFVYQGANAWRFSNMTYLENGDMQRAKEPRQSTDRCQHNLPQGQHFCQFSIPENVGNTEPISKTKQNLNQIQSNLELDAHSRAG